MKTRLHLVLVIALLCAVSSAQLFAAAKGETDIYASIKSALAIYNFDSLRAVRDNLIRNYELDKSNATSLYYITYSEYKLLEMCLRNDTAGRFAAIKESAEKHSALLINSKGFASEGKTVLAGIYMMRIAHNWSEAITLTPVFYTTLAEAEKLNAKNPRIFLMRGMMKFNTPEMFGGSKEEALTNFLKAISLFESDADSSVFNPGWGYLETLAWCGQVYAKLDNPETARFYYNKALAFDPENRWVKYVLLPALDKK